MAVPVSLLPELDQILEPILSPRNRHWFGAGGPGLALRGLEVGFEVASVPWKTRWPRPVGQIWT